MKPASIGIAIASRNEADLLAACLDATAGADAVVVFDLASHDHTAELSRSRGARVVALNAVPYIELARAAQLAEMTTDWVFFLDPDEILPPRWLAQVRDLITEADAEVAAFWIAYREVAFGRPLRHTRQGAAKIALIRRDHVAAPADPRPHQPLDVRGVVLGVSDRVPLVEHHGYRTVSGCIAKLARYAANGGVGIELPGPATSPTTGLKLLWRAVVMSQAWRDGAPGVAVATLSAVGDLLGGLQRWDADGRHDDSVPLKTSMTLRVGRQAGRLQWLIRRNVRTRLVLRSRIRHRRKPRLHP